MTTTVPEHSSNTQWYMRRSRPASLRGSMSTTLVGAPHFGHGGDSDLALYIEWIVRLCRAQYESKTEPPGCEPGGSIQGIVMTKFTESLHGRHSYMRLSRSGSSSGAISPSRIGIPHVRHGGEVMGTK
jgi:hypothetical protein